MRGTSEATSRLSAWLESIRVPVASPRGMPRDARAPARILALTNNSQPPADIVGLLSPDERTRAARMALGRDRRAFITTRAALRVLLAEETGVAPERLSLRVAPDGRPAMSDPHAPELDFSVSHTTGLSLIALARGMRVGADVELRRAISDPLAIAGQMFDRHAVDGLRSLPLRERERALLRLWTGAEAVAKLTGLGVAAFHPGASMAGALTPALHWLSLPEPYVGCVALDADVGIDGYAMPARSRSCTCTIPTGLPASATMS
jgi:4'-phosphopantetheinyl transferase